MKKNILIVTGSPRKNGNTDLMAEAFKKGAEANGHKVTIFILHQSKLVDVLPAILVGLKEKHVHSMMDLLF